jgi:hypothetical protein
MRHNSAKPLRSAWLPQTNKGYAARQAPRVGVTLLNMKQHASGLLNATGTVLELLDVLM